jgi:DNA-binding MarR family transcriptional regulator
LTVVSRGRSFQATVTRKGERYRRQFRTEGEAQVWELEAKAALMRGEQPALSAKAGTLGKPRTMREPLKWNNARHRNGQKAGEKVGAGRFQQSDGASRPSIFGREIHSLMRAIDAIWGEEPDMPVQQARTVLAVATRPGLAMGDLSRMVFMSQSLCSRTVAALSKWQRRGIPGLDLIETIEDPRERRRKIMYLTPKGRQRMTRALQALTGEAVYYDGPSARDTRKSFINNSPNLSA